MNESKRWDNSQSTSTGLLERARSSDADAWRRLAEQYGPLVYQWARGAGLQPSDAADVVQEVFRGVARGLATFRHDGPRSGFRAWLRTITLNKIRDYFRQRYAEPCGAGGSTALERFSRVAAPQRAESDQGTDSRAGRLWRRALEIGRARFDGTTWASFWGMVIEGRTAADIAEELGMTAGAVRQAKCRVLRRLRQELEESDDE